MKFKIGDKVLYCGQIRVIRNIHKYENNLTGLAVVSQMYRKAYLKDYELNVIDPHSPYENYANEEELKLANSKLVKEKLDIK